jgi:hypothetical protein
VEVLLMSEYEKFIYNTYLKVFRSSNNQPYRLRKDFNGIDDKTFICIKKLSSFFKRFAHINIEDFFRAPYLLYPDEKHFALDYYTTLKATKSYTLAQKKKINSDPDSEEQLTNIKQSLLFILRFCRERNLNPQNYINHKTNNEYSFTLHLKEHKVNLFVLLGYQNFEKNLKSRDAEVIKFIIGDDLYNNIQVFRTKLFNSKKANKLVELGLQKIIQHCS